MSLTHKFQESKILRGLLDNSDAGCPKTHKKQCLDNCTNIGSLSMKTINTQSIIRIEERFCVCVCVCVCLHQIEDDSLEHTDSRNIWVAAADDPLPEILQNVSCSVMSDSLWPHGL